MKRTPLRRRTPLRAKRRPLGAPGCYEYPPLKRAALKKKTPKHAAPDAWWRLKVKTRDGWHCQYESCGRGVKGMGGYSMEKEQLHAAHIHPRRFLATRWLLVNGLSLCWICDDFFTRNPRVWKTFCILKIGQAEYDRLYALVQAGPQEGSD